MFIDKNKITKRVATQEAIELVKYRTTEDIEIALDIAKEVIKQEQGTDYQWNNAVLLVTIWNAGRVQGVREERAKQAI